VRDLGELNRLLFLITDDGQPKEIILKEYRWTSFKGYMYRAQDILALAEVLGMVSIAGAKVKLTPLGGKFRGLNPDRQYELTNEQRDEICRFAFRSMTPLSQVVEDVLLNFKLSRKSGRYEYSIPDSGPPPGRKELYFFLETLRVLEHADDGTISVNPRYTQEIARKIRWFRQLTNDEKSVSPELLELSQHAERMCFTSEQNRLKLINRPDLAARVDLVADYDATVGYDILSYDGAGSLPESPDRFVEVKSTPTDNFHFFLSEPELKKAREYRGRYWIYHVRNVTLQSTIGMCSLQQIQDPAERILDSSVFEISAERLHVTCLRKDLGPPK
jgi:hypothetical protein